MRIAVTCENDEVFQHFGHTPEFAIFEIVENRLNGLRKVSTEGSGHSALAGLLAAEQVDLLLCGGIGTCAQDALAEAGIKVVGGVSGDIIQAVGDYLKGELKNNPNFTCASHHDHKSEGHGEGCHCHSH